MRLTQHTDYALRVLIYLGLRPNELSTIRQISESYGISKNHLMKVALKLSKAGYIDSVRGQSGGLRLNKPPGDIRLGALVKEMEPDFGLVECKRPNNQCIITSECKLPAILDIAIEAFIEKLDEHTVSDLLPEQSHQEFIRLLGI